MAKFALTETTIDISPDRLSLRLSLKVSLLGPAADRAAVFQFFRDEFWMSE